MKPVLTTVTATTATTAAAAAATTTTVPPESIYPLGRGKTCRRVLPRIHRSGTNSSTSSWTDVTECRGKPGAVYHGEETIVANLFC